MNVTAIKQQQKDQNRVSIYLDGKYSFSLTMAQLLEAKLKVGTGVDDSRLDELKKLSLQEKFRLKAMNWILLRPRSVREFQQYMQRKKKSPEEQQQLIDDFSTRGYLDDERFAQWWVERRSRRTRSASALRAELMQKGIAREVVGEMLDQKQDDQALRELIAKLGTRKRYEDKQKLMRYLVSKGFGYSSVAAALDEGTADSLED